MSELVGDIPPPPERPEDEGIPDHAADTSTAYDEADRPRFDDSPPPLPGDAPLAVDDFGVTAAEARRGEPLAGRLAREVPDVDTAEPAVSDADLLGVEPQPRPGDGAASEYDAPAAGEPVGRLVEPDEGVRTDTEKDMVAAEQGEAGGGLSAEEAAMHQVPDDGVPHRP